MPDEWNTCCSGWPKSITPRPGDAEVLIGELWSQLQRYVGSKAVSRGKPDRGEPNRGEADP
jgi:hypothetical protein